MKYTIDTDVRHLKNQVWRDFVLNHPYGNIFQTPEMYEVYTKSDLFEPIVVFALAEDQKLIGLLSAYVEKDFKGLTGNLTSRSVIFNGPLVYDEDVAFQLIKTYSNLVKRRAIYSQFRLFSYFEDFNNILKKAGYTVNDHQDILIDLTKGEEKLWEEVHTNRKKEIKKGIKKGLIVRELALENEIYISEIHALLKGLYKRIGLPLFSISFFRNFVDILEKNGLLKTFGAFVDDKLVGFRMVLVYKDLVFDWLAASDDNYLSYRPNDILPWEIFKWGHQNGFKTFDFGGAGKPGKEYGVRDYKLRFGGELVNYQRFEKIHKPVFYNLGVLGIKLWQKFKSKSLISVFSSL